MKDDDFIVRPGTVGFLQLIIAACALIGGLIAYDEGRFVSKETFQVDSQARFENDKRVQKLLERLDGKLDRLYEITTQQRRGK